MPDFTHFSDDSVVNYLIDHFDEIGAGPPSDDLVGRLTRGIGKGDLVVEKRNDAFAIIARANRTYETPVGFPGSITISPEAKLMFLMVANESKGKGLGSALVAEVKARYMEGQEMELECFGEERKHFFERAGFLLTSTHTDGQFDMVCPQQKQQLE